MSEIQDLVSDPTFLAAPTEKQASVLNVFFDKKMQGVPAAGQLDSAVLDQTRQAFIQKFLPNPQDKLLGGANATISAPLPKPPPVKAPDESLLQKTTDVVKGLASSGAEGAIQGAKAVATAPLKIPIMPAAIAQGMAQKEISDYERRGTIREGLGQPRSGLESAAEIAMRGAFLGGVVNRQDAPKTLKGTLLDILDIAGAAGGLAELAPAEAIKAATVVKNVGQVASHLNPEDVKLLGQVTEQLAENPVAAQVLKGAMPAATETAPVAAAAPAVESAAAAPKGIPIIKPAAEALEAKGQPFALYVGDQEGVGPMFNIYGEHPTLSTGRYMHSTVALDTVQKEGIPILGQEARAAGKTPGVPFDIAETAGARGPGGTPPPELPPTPPEPPPPGPPDGGSGGPPPPPPDPAGDLGQFNTERFKDPDVQKLIEETRQQSDVQAQIIAQKRGVMSDQMVSDLADKLDLTPEKLRGMAPGSVLNAEGVLRANMELEGHAKGLALLAEKRKAALAAGDQAALGLIRQDQQALTQPFVDMLVKTNAITSELGRALHAQKIAIGNMSPTMRQLIGDAVEGGIAVDPTELDRLLDKIGSLGGDANAIASELSSQIKPSLIDKIVDVATSLKLTSPVTLLRHNLGNALAVITRVGEKGMQGPIDMLRSTFTGTPRERFAGEAGGFLFGLGEGMQDGVLNFLSRMKGQRLDLNGVPMEGMTKFQPAIGGKTGNALHFMSRILEAGDQFFQTILHRGELYATALRQAAKEGLQMSDRWGRIQELVKNPTDEMLEAAMATAKEYNYKTPLGPATELLDKLRNTFGGLPKLFVPFFRTPVNVGKFFIQRSPLGVLPGSRNWEAFMAGGGSATDAMTRVAIGTTIEAALVDLALKGHITGSGPTNHSERDLLERSGWQPYSFRIGDKYVSYQLMDPLALASASDIATAWMQRKEVPTTDNIANLAFSTLKNLTNQPFLMGVHDALEAMRDERKAGKYIDRFANGLVPTGLRLITKHVDPIVRQPEGIVQNIESGIPGLSERVPPRMNVFGDPIQRERVFPVQASSEKHTPLQDELTRMHDATGLTVNFKQNRLNGRKLDQDDYVKYQQLAGQATKAGIEGLISTSHYQGISDAGKERAINRIVRDASDNARDQLTVHVELKALGLPDITTMGLPEDLQRTLETRIKSRIDTKAYGDKADDERKDALKEKMRDVLLHYKGANP